MKPTNHQVLERLYDTYVDDIFRYIRLRTSNKEQALDLTQEVFVRVWQSYISKGQTLEYEKALLYKIARNLLINSYERDVVHTSLDALAEASGFEVADTAQDTLRDARGFELHRKLEALSPEDADLIRLRHLEGFSVKEIAVMYDVSENTLSVRLHRALAKLEAQYTESPQHNDE